MFDADALRYVAARENALRRSEFDELVQARPLELAAAAQRAPTTARVRIDAEYLVIVARKRG